MTRKTDPGSATASGPTIARCVVLAGGWDYGCRKHVARLADAFPDLEWLVLVHRPRRSVRQRARSLAINLRKHGWRWIPYLLRHAWAAATERDASPDARRPGHTYSDGEVRRRPRVAVEDVADLNAESTAIRVRQWRADLGIAISAPILRPLSFDAPRLGCVNVHRGKVPDYRGMPVAFWELHDGAASVGCTIHWVSERLDAGDILLETSVPVPRHATVRGMQIILDDVGLELLVQAIGLLRDGKASSRTQEPGGKIRSRPPLALERALHKALATTQVRRGSRLRSLTKFLLFRGYVALVGLPMRIVRGLSGRQQVVVLLYHRVNDDMRDELTTGVEQFERHVRWLVRRCTLTSLDDLACGRSPRRSLRPVVAITFDDGYLDNARLAAPILERYGVPAAFFVATALVGTDRPFPHDQRSGRGAIPIMSWEHVRALAASGFTIGSHTASHLDCGSAPLELVHEELSASKAALERELGLRQVLFAYPYGGREHITPDVLKLVRELGFAGCFSAFGGNNRGRLDPFQLRRKGIHHDFDLAALSARVHGFG